MVSDTEIQKVLIISDKKYADKANGRDGGVGTETQIISAEVYKNRQQEKFVAGRSICRVGSIRMESRRTFCGFWEAPGKRNQVADGKKILN